MGLPGIGGVNPGFQGSETTSAKVMIFPRDDDPILLASLGTGAEMPVPDIKSMGPSGGVPTLTNVQTIKDISAASGTFAISMKPSPEALSIYKRVADDDWVDIIFFKHDKPFHVMRGLVDENRKRKTMGGTGATSEALTIVGRDFGKVWETTPVWFSPYAEDVLVLSDTIAKKVFEVNASILGSPGEAAIAFLKEFQEQIVSKLGVGWEMPKIMPGTVGGDFIKSIEFNLLPTGAPKYFQNKPMRHQFNPGGMAPNGRLWELAKEYSDPMFTELYVDLLPNGDPFSPLLGKTENIDPMLTKMAVVMRDKPFPLLNASVPPGYMPTWGILPSFEVSQHELISEDVGRSGYERFNAYYVSTHAQQELLPEQAIHMMAPLIDQKSVLRHGLRRMDIQSSVLPDLLNVPPMDPQDMCKYQRQVIRDWYCLNPYFYSGTLTCGHGRPDIKIGCKVVVPGAPADPTQVAPDTTYYVETATNDWTFGQGMRTSLGVTRGWEGTGASYQAALVQEAAKYTEPFLKPRVV